jgi:hypothetical protein
MLEFLRHRHCPEENPPHDRVHTSLISTLFSCSSVWTIASFLGFTPLNYRPVYQAQPAIFTATYAVIQK